MDGDVDAHRSRLRKTAATVILLDTNAIIWLLGGGSCAATLTARLDPADVVEL